MKYLKTINQYDWAIELNSVKIGDHEVPLFSESGTIKKVELLPNLQFIYVP